MEAIVLLKGEVNYSITLDPSVWIFDDRRVDLNTFFSEKEQVTNELEEYTKSISKHWDREIMEGATLPPTLKTEKKYEKKKMLSGTFGMKFEPFLKNAQPKDHANKIIVRTSNEDYTFDLEEANNWILAFSTEGKPLKEDGPVHILFSDGSNRNNPIKKVMEFIIE